MIENYEVRFMIDESISMKDADFDTEKAAVAAARRRSKKEYGRLYFVKKITSEIIFSVKG